MWIHCNKGRLARGGGSLGIRGDKSGPRFHFWVADTKTKMGGGAGGACPLQAELAPAGMCPGSRGAGGTGMGAVRWGWERKAWC